MEIFAKYIYIYQLKEEGVNLQETKERMWNEKYL